MVWIFILFLLVVVLRGIASLLEAREAAKKEKALEAFKRENPELWMQQERLKLEKEEASRENSRRNVGMVVGIGRGLGWW
jgi:hypothetical protein